jgi:TPR repeat protein
MRVWITAAGAAWLTASALAAPSPWLEIKSDHFTVFTNAGDKAGRHAAWEFEQIRAVLQKLWPWAKIDGKPVIVFAAKDEPTLKSLGPQYWEGKRYRPISFMQGGRDALYIVLRTDVAAPDDIATSPYQSAYWSYVAAVFNRSFPRRPPLWYSRGVAEVMSNTFVRAKEVHVGRPIRARLDVMLTRAAIPLGEFLHADYRSHWLTQEADAERFDAQAWGLVHYLMFGEQAARLQQVGRFNQLLYSGTDPDAAAKEAFGDLAPLFDSMRGYMQRTLLSYVRYPIAVALHEDALPTRPTSAAESAVRRAELLAAMKRPLEARALADEASKADPALPGPFEVEASLVDDGDHVQEARQAYAKAVERGSQNPGVYYRLAQLSFTSDADKSANERLAALLEKARELDPGRANTLSFLADVRCSLGQAGVAVPLAQRAVELEPANSYHRVAFARALWNNGQPAESIAAARSALAAAEDDAERQRAQSLLDFVTQSSPPPRPTPPAAAAADVPASPVRIAPTGPRQDRALAQRFGKSSEAVSRCVFNREAAACVEAAPTLDEACQWGKGEACRLLGSLYDGGIGVAKDKTRAAMVYDAGCRSGEDKPSCARYAVLQAQGQGVERDAAAAMHTLETLCDEKVDDACIGWALLLRAKPGAAEAAKAQELLSAACARSSEEACRLLRTPAR